MFEYGRHLGLAFQVVDDILDFTTATEQLGKPQVRFSRLLLTLLQTLRLPNSHCVGLLVSLHPHTLISSSLPHCTDLDALGIYSGKTAFQPCS